MGRGGAQHASLVVGAGAGVGALLGVVVGRGVGAAAPVMRRGNAEGVVGRGGAVDQAAGADLVRVVAAAFGIVLRRFAVLRGEVDEGFVVCGSGWWWAVGDAVGV